MIGVLLLTAMLADSPAGAAMAPDEAAQLVGVKRVFVDRFTGPGTAAQLRDLTISSLQNARLFVVTENEARADAFLRGAAEDSVYTDQFISSESASAHGTTGTGSTRTGRITGRVLNGGASDQDTTNIKERKHEALATVRLVNKDGDVIWSTTQESGGGKFRGAGADVADKVARQLTADMEKAKRAVR